eukprot:1083426-Rhodomonas_salina.2
MRHVSTRQLAASAKADTICQSWTYSSKCVWGVRRLISIPAAGSGAPTTKSSTESPLKSPEPQEPYQYRTDITRLKTAAEAASGPQ